MDSETVTAAAQAAAAVLTALGGFFLGLYRRHTRAESRWQQGDQRDREQLFKHYNELIQTNREMNHSLRTDLQTVRAQMHAIQIDNAVVLADLRAEREACRVENERLKSDLRHLKADLAEMKTRLAAQD